MASSEEVSENGTCLPQLAAPAAEAQPDDETRWLSEREQSAWRRLLRDEARIHDLLDRDLRRSHNLTLGGYAVLVHLSEAGPDGMRMSDLAELLVISRSGLTRRVGGLVKSGLVTRMTCPVDGRGTVAALSPAGEALLRKAAPIHVSGVRRYLIDPIGDLGALEVGLERVEAALDAAERETSSSGGT
jgi:DNA-binding MarR family transcriptional regulator